MQEILINNGWIQFEEKFLSQEESFNHYQKLIETLPWKQGEINLFGKTHPIPRLESFHTSSPQSYSYSGQTMISNPFTETLEEIKNKIESSSGFKFNSVLANLYRNGMDSNGWHSDNEKELGLNPIIASLSLGCSRRFDLRHNLTKEKRSFQLESGSLLIMGGELQHYWKHQLAKSKKIHEPRINLTFRTLI